MLSKFKIIKYISTLIFTPPKYWNSLCVMVFRAIERSGGHLFDQVCDKRLMTTHEGT